MQWASGVESADSSCVKSSPAFVVFMSCGSKLLVAPRACQLRSALAQATLERDLAMQGVEESKEWNVDHTFAPVGRPTGNTVAQRVIRTMREQCIWLRDWVSLKDLEATLAVWQPEYNERRPHQALH